MKQIVQSASSGKLELLEVPAPAPDRGQVLLRTHFSVVSPGTEKSSLDFARKSLLGKARSRPDLVKQVTRKLRQEGPVQTYRAVMGRLDAPQALGYSCAGVVEAVGEGVTAFAPGDRVACGGAGYANHAELNVVPENLCVAVPDGLPLEKAAYATVGAIALQAVRLSEPTLGEVVAVIGLGLIGQLTVQLLRANGCRVLGIDTQRERIKQSLDMGAEWALSADEVDDGWANQATGGHGADFAVVAASADSSAPIELAARLCRLKGRIVLVGTMPIDLDRRWFFEKELEFKVSMSYGPGRYDRRYEEMGLDYPLAYVRWTENRNMQAFLGLAARGSVHPDRLDTEIVDFSEAEKTYEALARGERRHLSILFRYESGTAAPSRSIELEGKRRSARDSVGIAFIGAGNYAMCGKAYDPRLIFAWPTARLAVMDGGIAADTVLMTKRDLNDEAKKKFREELVKKYDTETSPYYSAARMVVDGIVDPRETRNVLIEGLEMAQNNPDIPDYKTGVLRL